MVINRANIVNNIVRGGKEAAYASYRMAWLESNGREDSVKLVVIWFTKT